MTGHLAIIIGPMFGGKSSELQRRIKRDIYACRRVCIIRYGKDNRYSHNFVTTHDQSHIRPNFSVEKLSEIGDQWLDYDTLAVDEGQFFPDLVEFCTLAADAGKNVIVSALDGDFRRRPFGKVCELIPHAEEVVKLTAVCMACHEAEACFTRRTVNSTEQELIGGADMYIAVCRDCFNTETPPTPGRVNRYKQNVKEVERMTLRGIRASAEVRPEGEKNVSSATKETTTAATQSSLSQQNQQPNRQPLRRSRNENVQPGSSQNSTTTLSQQGTCKKFTKGGEDGDAEEGNNSNLGIQSPVAAAPGFPPLTGAN